MAAAPGSSGANKIGEKSAGTEAPPPDDLGRGRRRPRLGVGRLSGDLVPAPATKGEGDADRDEGAVDEGRHADEVEQRRRGPHRRAIRIHDRLAGS